MRPMIDISRNFTRMCAALALTLVMGGLAAEGETQFEQRCAQCHDAADPAGPARDWFDRLEAMGPLGELEAEQRMEVLDFLRHHERRTTEMIALAEEKQLFEDKCSMCHTTDRVFLEPMTPETRRHIVLRMQERAPDWISPDEAEQILAYLGQTEPVEFVKPAEARMEPGTVFRERCSVCHTLERVYLHLEESEDVGPVWLHIVQRMRSKAPEWIDEDEARMIMEYLEGLKPVIR